MKQILAKLRLAPEDLRVVLSYERRRYKAVEVDSSASPARAMMLYNPPPGRYIGLGDRVVRSDDSQFALDNRQEPGVFLTQ